jgi:hypothetical protein
MMMYEKTPARTHDDDDDDDDAANACSVFCLHTPRECIMISSKWNNTYPT